MGHPVVLQKFSSISKVVASEKDENEVSGCLELSVMSLWMIRKILSGQ